MPEPIEAAAARMRARLGKTRPPSPDGDDYVPLEFDGEALRQLSRDVVVAGRLLDQ